jgi:hypothetical protein
MSARWRPMTARSSSSSSSGIVVRWLDLTRRRSGGWYTLMAVSLCNVHVFLFVTYFYSLWFSCIIQLGYQARVGLAQAGNHGVPQSRRRIFIYAARLEYVCKQVLIIFRCWALMLLLQQHPVCKIGLGPFHTMLNTCPFVSGKCGI